MLKFFIFCCISLFTMSLTAQSIDWSHHDSSNYGYLVGVEELNSSDIVTIETINLGTWTNRISTLGKDGSLLNNVLYQYENYQTTVYYSIHNSQDETLLTFSTLFNTSKDSSFMLITLWDYELEILREDLHYIGEKGILQYQGKWTGNDEISVIGTINLTFADTLNNFDVFMILDGNGNIKKQKIYNQGVPIAHAYDICKSIDGNSFISGGAILRKLDADLNILIQDTTFLGQTTGNQFTLRTWNDTSYIFGSSGYNPDDVNDTTSLIIHVFNDNFESIKHLTLGNKIYKDVGFPINNLDGLDKGNMYFAAFSVANGGLKLFNFNKELEINWQQEIKFDKDYYYQGWKMIATRDSGCILTGRFFKSQFDFNPYPCILKISNNYVGTHNILPSGIKEIVTLYPNPSIGDLRIDLQGNTDISMTIYNQQGVMVSYGHLLKEGSNNFNHIDLPAGLYFIHLEKNGKDLGTQQWIKL